jgi:hypothetical protein
MTVQNGFGAEAGEDIPKRPGWLDDEPEIIAILGTFLDKLDRKPIADRARIPSVGISKTIAPALHRHDESADRTWEFLRSLDGLVFEVRPSRKRQPYDAEYVGASLRFLAESERICRDWLARPRLKRYPDEWVKAVEAHADAFADSGASLHARPIRVTGKSANEVVQGFAEIGAFQGGRFTLRQLSARAFWGHSKVLDTREDLVQQLYPEIEVAPRPILLHVYLPESIEGVLFIENQDTYVQALSGRPTEVARLALVYGAGFKSSAARIKTNEGVVVHYQGDSARTLQADFEAWWFDQGPSGWSAWFWGDLDFSGLGILKALRQRFGNVQAWRPGYTAMLRLLCEGRGHSADTADKAEQVDPGFTGCPFADEELLPAIRKIGRFVDQEAV